MDLLPWIPCKATLLTWPSYYYLYSMPSRWSS